MSFKETLREIVGTVGGGLGAVIMGYDGIAIDEYLPDDGPIDIQLLAVEYATLLKEVRRTVELLKNGDLDEMVIATTTTRAIVRTITNDFFIILLMAPDGNFGKARFLLRRETPQMREALQ